MFTLEDELTDFEAHVLKDLAYTSQITDAITPAEEKLLIRLAKKLRPKDNNEEKQGVS